MGLFGLPAQAVIITVGGVDYDVVYFTNGFHVPQGSFNDNIATLTDPASAPWWGITPDGPGGTIDAEDFAAAYLAQVGVVNVSVGGFGFDDKLVFSYAIGGGGTFTFNAQVIEGGSVSLGQTSTAANSAQIVHAYTVPIPAAVPEIDGNALAKALFILFALGAWLHTRRARVS